MGMYNSTKFGNATDLIDLRAALNNRAADLAIDLLGPPTSKSKSELRWGSKGALSVTVVGSKAGLWHDFASGVGGDLFDLIQRERGGGFRDAVEYAGGYCGVRINTRRPSSKPKPTPKPKPAPDDDEGKRLRLAQYLWSQGRATKATPAERYLRGARGIDGPIPPTFRYLPARDQYAHALMCAFALPEEPEPGVLRINDHAVRGLHLIRLTQDGSDRDRTPNAKITIGHCMGTPIVCTPFSDSNNALVIAEGVEDALSAGSVMGIGAWAAGGASRMSAFAEMIPDYIDCVTICVDIDDAGQTNSVKLARLLRERNFEVRLLRPNGGGR